MEEDRQHLHNVSVDIIKKNLGYAIRSPDASSEMVAATDSSYEKIKLESQKLALELKKLELRNLELHDVIQLRRSWSTIFKGIVVSVFLFEILLTVFVGLNWLKYKDEWFLRIIILGGIAQILAMPVLVTQFLFNTQSPLSKGEES